MIAFKKGSSPSEYPEKGFKELMGALLNHQDIQALGNKFAVGTYHGGLHADHIKEIIKYIMYVEECEKVNLTISKESDDYRLAVKINKKKK